ncbi:hypothetical protein SRHO_G00025460 [Serrasalmus rhombeus]
MESQLDCLTSTGREFQSLGADLEKAWSPKPWRLDGGMVSSPAEDDLREKPMEALENRGNVVMCVSVGEETGGRVLNHLKFVNGGRADSCYKRVTIVETAGNGSMDKDFCS